MKLSKKQTRLLLELDRTVEMYGYNSNNVFDFNSKVNEPDKSIINNIILGEK